MLQDPVKGVLVPLSPEESRALSAVPLAFNPAARHDGTEWIGLGHVVAHAAEQELALGETLQVLQPLPAPDAGIYERAYSALIGGDHGAAAAAFATAALSGGAAAVSLYGLALALLELGQHEEAETVAAFVAQIPGFSDPRAAALAGYAAFQRRQPKTARVHLAKAARLARLQPEFRGVQRFAQRVLLMQQFALGD